MEGQSLKSKNNVENELKEALTQSLNEIERDAQYARCEILDAYANIEEIIIRITKIKNLLK